MLSQSFNSTGRKLLIPANFWRDNNFNSFCTNNTEIYGNLKVFVVFGEDYSVQHQLKSVSK